MMIVSAAHSFQSVFVRDLIHFFPYLIQLLYQSLCDRIGYCKMCIRDRVQGLLALDGAV